jgi:hypothetical protein
MATSTKQSTTDTSRMAKAKRYLRLFMMDTPELNRLINKYESDDEMLTFAIEMTISDWNSTTPLIGAKDIGNFPSLYLLMHGAAIQLLKSQGLRQARNELNYSAGGSSFIRSNKSNYYMSWMVNFANEYETKKRNMKIQQNINRGWGGVNSEYDWIGYAW